MATYLSSVANTFPPRSSAIMPIISCNRTLQPTPPTISTSLLPMWAIARSVISTSMANMVSCGEKHMSSALSLVGSSSSFWRCCLASCSTNDSIPENETSMPFTVYGRSASLLPRLADCSMLYPGLGSFGSLITRANRSRQFPIAISRVSPNMRGIYVQQLNALQSDRLKSIAKISP